MKLNKFITTALAAVAVSAAVNSAYSQNNAYVAGDLVLSFQNPGGTVGSTNTILVRLGGTAAFRDATSSQLNIINIGTALSNATTGFGTSWASSTTLFASLSGVWGTSSTSPALQNLDPHRTLYVSNVRQIIGGSYGTAGVAQETGAAPATNGISAQNVGASGMLAQNGRLEEGPLAINGIATQNPFSETVTTSNLDDQQPGGNSGDAFSAGLSDIGDQGETGNVATFAGVNNIEFALDLYRLQTRNDIAGQYGLGDANFIGEFQGTVVIANDGNVSFIAVPEPSTYAFLGLGALALAAAVRRHFTAKA